MVGPTRVTVENTVGLALSRAGDGEEFSEESPRFLSAATAGRDLSGLDTLGLLGGDLAFTGEGEESRVSGRSYLSRSSESEEEFFRAFRPFLAGRRDSLSSSDLILCLARCESGRVRSFSLLGE